MSTPKETDYLLRLLESQPPRYQIIQFDLDDTLIDGQACHLAAWQEAAEKTNLSFPGAPAITITPEFRSFQKGRPTDEAARGLGIAPHSERGLALIEFKKKGVAANAHRATWFVDALKMLPQLPERGYEVRIVTSSHRKYVETVLAGHAALGFLQTRITAREDYERGKPEPDSLIVACGAAGVALEKTIYVGDSWPDRAASRAAGCAFLLYSPKGAPTEEGLQGTPYIVSHDDIWRYI